MALHRVGNLYGSFLALTCQAVWKLISMGFPGLCISGSTPTVQQQTRTGSALGCRQWVTFPRQHGSSPFSAERAFLLVPDEIWDLGSSALDHLGYMWWLLQCIALTYLCTGGPKLLVCAQEVGMLLLAEYCLLNLAAEWANQSIDYLIMWHVDYCFLVINKTKQKNWDVM